MALDVIYSNLPPITVEGICNSIIYTQQKSLIGEVFGIYSFTIEKVIEGFFPAHLGRPPFCTVHCIGNSSGEISEGGRYEFSAQYETSPKYGPQLHFLSIKEVAAAPADMVQWEYLKAQLSPSAYEKLTEARKYADFDVLKAVQDGNITTLCTLKGIKQRTAERIVNAYKAGQDKLEMTVELVDLGFTAAMRENIMRQYRTPAALRALCKELKQNFYAAIGKIRGYSWGKTDKTAREKHGYAEDSKERIQAYVLFYLDSVANDKGHSWIDKDELIGAIFEIAPNAQPQKIGEYLSDMLNHDLLFYDRETKRIGSQVLYDVEKDTARQLARLMAAKNWELPNIDYHIKRCEEQTGFEYTPQQRAIIHGISENKVTLVTGVAGCVDADTEFFTGTGWKRIVDWEQGDKVLQYNPDGTAELVTPERYIKSPQEQLWSVHTKYGLDFCVSDEHAIVYETSKGNLAFKKFADAKRLHENASSGFSGKFYTTFHYSGTGIDISDIDLKIMLAVICDGSFQSHTPSSTWCRFHLKKERKKERLRALLQEGGYEYRERASAAPGYTDFVFYAPLRTKVFPKEWYNMTQAQLQIVCDNVLFWDGTTIRNRQSFSANVQENIDFVQFAFAACGKRATIQARDRRGEIRGKYVRKSIDYSLTITARNKISMGRFKSGRPSKTKIIPYPTIDGYQYCFTVPSHMWVSRRNGRIVITGNSGKTHAMFPITEALKAAHKEFRIAALSGKASLNIGEATHSIEQSCTIHRLLGFYKGDRDTEDTAFFDTTEADSAAANGSVVPRNPITHKLCIDLLIIDEVSMIGGYLFRRVVEALPDHAKLVLVGDEGQLEAIGYANVLWDIKRSAVVPYYTLTQIMRQAARSGILSDSLKIYRKEQFIPPDLVRPAVHGELQDFRIVPCETAAHIAETIPKEYRAFIQMGIPVEDIIVVTQKRAAGILSAHALNNVLQDIANPHTGQAFIKTSFTDSGTQYNIEFRVGDRVMMIQNEYEVPLCERAGRVAVFNGNMGTVIEAGGTAQSPWLVVQFPQGLCRLSKGLIAHLQLGYAATCHKLQGSGIPYVIGVVDPAAYTLLTNEALYTEITRAKKYCILLGSPRTIRKAVRTSTVKKKQTWLAELLREEVEEVKNIDDPF